jgi:pimeloyl-ACP methyl ester carboxylesterase
MQNKSIYIEGFRLSYLEKKVDSKKIIFFIHGNSGSSNMWKKQFDSVLFKNYNLIAIDLPGHGNSFSSDNPLDDYSPIGTANILSEAIKNIAGNNPYLLVGFSYGSNLCVEILQSDLHPNGIILVGCTVMGENYGIEKIFTQLSTPSILFYNETDEKIIGSYFQEYIPLGNEEDIKNSIDNYLRVTPEFKPALFKTAAEGKVSDEIKKLQTLNLPACVIFGEKDKLVNIDYLDKLPFPLWRNKIFKLQNAGHWVNIDQPDMFNQIVSEYINEMFIAGHA